MYFSQKKGSKSNGAVLIIQQPFSRYCCHRDKMHVQRFISQYTSATSCSTPERTASAALPEKTLCGHEPLGHELINHSSYVCHPRSTLKNNGFTISFFVTNILLPYHCMSQLIYIHILNLINYLCLLSVRIWEHLSSHRRWADLLYNLRSTGDSSVWILIGWCWGPVGDHFWEGHRQSREDDCGELMMMSLFWSVNHLRLLLCVCAICHFIVVNIAILFRKCKGKHKFYTEPL